MTDVLIGQLKDAERRGYAKPSLADELTFLEQYYGAVERGGE